ncbi:MAG: alpha/beta hydrolase, partial [Bacteroidales bacterium]|nr:alpha/beta hydrolase [Bacteroidales bacterium]
RYRKPCYRVSVEKDVPYGHVKGYWAEIPEGEDKGFDLIRKLREVGEEQDLELTMDIYKPQHDALKHRPLIMMIHGGAFYLGAKDSPNYIKWCEHLSSLGYVVASINYRLGFKLNLSAIERSAYCAVQDAHAAMRFLVEERETYGIDTSMIFVGGSSAGAITSLNLAYMTEAYRPVTSFDDEERDLPDLGPINKSGNRCKADFDIKGVVNMWGAVSNLEMFDAKKVPILSFHGDKDDIVPYKYDYPFKAVGAFKKTLFNKMYGSYNIQQRAEANRIPAELHTFKGWKHEPQVDKNDSINDNFYLIQDKMDIFFRDIVAPVKPAIVASKEEEGCYYVRPANAEFVSWEVEGGFVIEQNGNEIKVVWISNAPRRYLRVSGKLPYDYGFVERRNINLKKNG